MLLSFLLFNIFFYLIPSKCPNTIVVHCLMAITSSLVKNYSPTTLERQKYENGRWVLWIDWWCPNWMVCSFVVMQISTLPYSYLSGLPAGGIYNQDTYFKTSQQSFLLIWDKQVSIPLPTLWVVDFSEKNTFVRQKLSTLPSSACLVCRYWI